MVQLPQAGDIVSSFSMVDLLVSLVLCFILGLVISAIYRITHRGMNYERSFLVTLVMIAPIIALIMIFISSNLALSLGMVGALSIIRFRTVIKDSRDMAYLFLVVAVGLGCGTFNWFAVSAATALILVALLVLYYLEYGRARHLEYVLVISGQEEISLATLKKIISEQADGTVLRSFDSTREHWEAVFEIRISQINSELEDKLIATLKQNTAIDKVSVLAPQLALPV